MAIICRPMRPRDVADCVVIVAGHTALVDRYGDVLNSLRSVWLSLLGREAFRAYVYKDVQDSSSLIVGVGCSAIVSSDFLRKVKTPPFFWIGPELTRRVRDGNSPLLSDKQVREANSKGGVNLVIWEGATHVDYVDRTDLLNSFLGTFIELHRGFLLNEVVGNGFTRGALAAVMRAGYLLVSKTDGSYTDTVDGSIHDVIGQPHIVGLTRELAPGRAGTWASSLFVYQAPRFGFTASEQRLLLTALLGGTDNDLADERGISLSAVKKAWQSIYERVSVCDPELAPSPHMSEAGAFERGKMKKQRLIAYLHDHPEELRPASE
jgi:DNA-binding CsgD family transcriptional regulator